MMLVKQLILADEHLEKMEHGKGGLFLVTQAGNIAVDLANGEAGVKTALNLAVDTVLFVAQIRLWVELFKWQ